MMCMQQYVPCFASTPHCSFQSFGPRVLLLFVRMRRNNMPASACRKSVRQHSYRTSQKHGAGTAQWQQFQDIQA